MQQYNIQRFLINLLLLISVGLLTISSFVAYYQIDKLLEANKWVIHTYKVKDTTGQISDLVLKSELAARTYLVTNDKTYVNSLPQYMSEIKNDLFHLQELTKDNPKQQENVQKLAPLINSQIGFLMKIFQADSLDKKKLLLNQIAARQLRPQIDQIFLSINEEEFTLLNNRHATFLANANQSVNGIILTGALGITLLVISFILLNYFLMLRHYAEQKRQELESHLKKIIDGSNELIAALDLDYRLIAFNEAYANRLKELTGTTIKVGMDLKKILHNYLGRDQIINVWKRALDGDEFTIVAKFDTSLNEDERFYEATYSAIKDTENNRIGAAHIMRDITQRRKVDQLKNEFISLVSHELRTPLTTIKGSLGLLKSGVMGNLEDKPKNMVEIAYTNSERLINLINDMLDIEKLEANKIDFHLTAVDLNMLIQEAVNMNKILAEKYKIVLHTVLPQDSVKVCVDYNRLLQVVNNLISNAIKFSPLGSSVEIQLTVSNGKAHVAVTDHGPGINDEFKKFIFQKFSQADSSAMRKHGGSGLGLNICKSIIEKLGGKIDFITEKKVGSTFYFDLPLWEAKHDIPKTNEINNSKIFRKKLQILYIEDDQDLFNLIKALLRNEAMVIHAVDKHEAKRVLAKRSFDLILLDLELPDGSGTELLPQFRKMHIPIIVFSAYELPKKYTNFVASALIKSKTSNKKLLDTIRKAIRSTPTPL